MCVLYDFRANVLFLYFMHVLYDYRANVLKSKGVSHIDMQQLTTYENGISLKSASAVCCTIILITCLIIILCIVIVDLP